jgi:hypothetical protein
MMMMMMMMMTMMIMMMMTMMMMMMMIMMLQIDLARPVIDVRTSSEQDKIRERDYNLPNG